MKSLLLTLFACIITLATFTSCDKLDEEKTTCEFNDSVVVVEPICSFNPKNLQEVPFPVYALYNGEQMHVDDYTFSYSTNPTFGGSAISVKYINLPLTITILEKATNCEVVVTLEKSYWD